MKVQGLCDCTIEIGNSVLRLEIEYRFRHESESRDTPAFTAADLSGVYVEWWEVIDDERHRGESWVWSELDRIAFETIESQWEAYADLCLEDAEKRGWW